MSQGQNLFNCPLLTNSFHFTGREFRTYDQASLTGKIVETSES